jgi:hypothetical protein
LCEEATNAAEEISVGMRKGALMLPSCGGVEAKKHETFCNKPEYKEQRKQTENRNPPIAQGEVT